MRNPPKAELEGHSSVGGFDLISALGKLFLVLTEEWRWKPLQKLPLLQITEPLIQAVPRAQSRALRYKGINSSSFWAIRIWAGAVPAREHPSPGSPCSDSFCVRILTRFSSFLLPPQRVFPRGFLRFCGFLFVLLRCFFCIGGCFVNETLHFPEFITPSLLLE